VSQRLCLVLSTNLALYKFLFVLYCICVCKLYMCTQTDGCVQVCLQLASCVVSQALMLYTLISSADGVIFDHVNVNDQHQNGST